MRIKHIMLAGMLFAATILSGCSNLLVLDPEGPAARTLSNTIIFSMAVMLVVVIVVWLLYAFMLSKYRASKMPEDYEPPHVEGSKVLEAIWIAIPVIIVAILSVVTLKTTAAVETVAKGYEDQKPLVIYASSSDWKWHFSYPEEGIETVNYVNIPTNRPVEFRLYSHTVITSFWVPQLAGQKYAMSDMVNTLNLVAETAGSYVGKNANFSGEGFADMEFELLAMSDKEYDEWVTDVKATAPKLTEEKFAELLKTNFVGRETFSSTHLTFSPAPEMNHDDTDKETDGGMDHDMKDMKGMEGMDHTTDSTD